MSDDDAALTNFYVDDGENINNNNNDVTIPYNCSGITLPKLHRQRHWNCNYFLSETSIDYVTSSNSTALNNVSDVNAATDDGLGLRWGALWLTVVIILTAVGNSLVCLAVCTERRLQNMTNYFLMSLAIADLLVSLVVMPFAMIVELYGRSLTFLHQTLVQLYRQFQL